MGHKWHKRRRRMPACFDLREGAGTYGWSAEFSVQELAKGVSADVLVTLWGR